MKLHRNFVILFLCLISLGPLIIISEYRVKNNIVIEEITLETHYIHPIRKTNIYSDFQIQILTPKNQGNGENPSTLFPVCIILHGDTIGPESTIMVQRELIDNGFLVVMMKIDSYELYQTIHDLNNTLTYVMTRNDINSSQICMYGHSRGGLYSMLFGAVRKDVIRGVISANYAEWDGYYHQVRVLSATIVPNFLLNYSPSGVLFVLDENDKRQPNESREFFTKWLRSTDFNVFLSSTSYGHASGAYYSEAIYTEITWLNSILGRELPYPAEEVTSFHGLASIRKNISTTLIMLGIEIVLLILILRNVIWLFSNQKMYYTKFHQIWKRQLKKYRLNRTTIKEHLGRNKSPPTSSSLSSEQPLPLLPIREENDGGNKLWRHARLWMKHDATIKNPGLLDDRQLHQKYQSLIAELTTSNFSARMLITLGSIFCFQLFLTLFWSKQIEQFYLGSMVVLYLEDVLGQNTSVIVDSSFKIPFMWYWIGLFIFIGYYQIRTKELHELGDYSNNHTLRGWGVALEIFLVFYFLLYLISHNFVGNLLELLAMRNIIAFLLFLKFFNLFTLEFFYDRIKNSKLVYWKSATLNALLLGFITLFGYIVSDEGLNLPLLVGFACVVFLNPTIYRFSENSKTATLLDYLLMITIFALFRF